MDHQYPTLAKIPVLDTGKFEQWQFRIQQYLQLEYYALWEVIEFGDSHNVPANDINQIDEDDMEEMDIKWNMALLSMRQTSSGRELERRLAYKDQMWQALTNLK
nr:hypothetical protein [Tanacetum cinerariifolium]